MRLNVPSTRDVRNLEVFSRGVSVERRSMKSVSEKVQVGGRAAVG